MISANDGSMVVLSPVASLTNATNYLSFDTSGFDYANIAVLVGTHLTTTAVVTGLQIGESDTITSPSSMTAITALGCSNTTSTSNVNSLPAATVQGLGGVITEFQIDLRKRKKYVGLSINSDTVVTAVVAAIARLSRPEQSSDTAAEKSLPLNLSGTAVVSCQQIVSA